MPPRFRSVSMRGPAPWVGSRACRPFAPAATAIPKVSTSLFQVMSAERRAVPAVEPGEHLPPRDHRHRARLRGGHDEVGEGVVAVVAVDVGGDGAVVALGPQRAVEQRIDGERLRLAGLVRDVGRGLVDVDHRAVEVGEPHGHAGAREVPGPVRDPGVREVVVVGVEPDPVVQGDLGLGGPVAPRDAVGAVGDRRRAPPRTAGGWRTGRAAGRRRYRARRESSSTQFVLMWTPISKPWA